MTHNVFLQDGTNYVCHCKTRTKDHAWHSDTLQGKKKLTKADKAGMEAILASSPNTTELRLPTWLIRGYIVEARLDELDKANRAWLDLNENGLNAYFYTRDRELRSK